MGSYGIVAVTLLERVGKLYAGHLVEKLHNSQQFRIVVTAHRLGGFGKTAEILLRSQRADGIADCCHHCVRVGVQTFCVRCQLIAACGFIEDQRGFCQFFVEILLNQIFQFAFIKGNYAGKVCVCAVFHGLHSLKESIL